VQLFERQLDFPSPIPLAKSSYVAPVSRMMKLVQKRRKGESEKLSSNGKMKQARKAIGGGVQSGLRAFFSKPGAGTKGNTPPTSPEKGDSDVEIITIDSDSSKETRKRKKAFDLVEVARKRN
jgi:hypothetical protein